MPDDEDVECIPVKHATNTGKEGEEENVGLLDDSFISCIKD